MKNCIAILITFCLLFSNMLSLHADSYKEYANDVEYTATDVDTSVEPSAFGMTGYLDFIKKYDFIDVKGYEKRSATLMAALGITKGVGGKKFAGRSPLTNIQTIMMMVRMLAKEQEVLDDLKAKHPETPLYNLKRVMYDSYVEKARALNVIKQADAFDYNKSINRETFARWFVDATSVTNENPRKVLEGASDYNDVTAETREPVGILLDAGVMTLFPTNKFLPKLSLKRGDFAIMMNRAFDKFAANLGIEQKQGLIIGIKTVGDKTDYTLRNTQNEIVKLRTGKNESGYMIGFPVLMGNKLLTNTNLKVGDEIEYFTKDKGIFYAVKLNNDKVKRQMVESFINSGDFKIVQGQVVKNFLDSEVNDSNYQTKQRIVVKTDDLEDIDFLGLKDVKNNLENDFLILRGSKFIKPAQVKEKEPFTAYVKDNKVLFAVLGASKVDVVKGTVRKIDKLGQPNKITVLGYDGSVKTYIVHKDTNYTVNGYASSLDNLKENVDVSMIVVRGVAEFVNSSSFAPAAGYIEKQGKITFGVVKNIEMNTIFLKDSDDRIVVYQDTLIKKDAQNIRFDDIKIGDRLKIYYDDITTDAPSKIIVEDKGALVTKIVKAKIRNYKESTKELNINGANKLFADNWIKDDSYMTNYKLADDCEIYANGKKLERSDINSDYRDSFAYMFIRENSGREEVGRVVYKTGYEKNLNASLYSHDDMINKMYLQGNTDMYFDEETIFISENRIVTRDDLIDNNNVTIVANTVNGINKAKIVNIDNGNNSVYSKVVVGEIDNIGSYNIEISNYSYTSIYGNLQFKEIIDTPIKFSMSDESYFYDLTLNRRISRKELFNGNYEKTNLEDYYDYSNPRYQRYYGIFALDENDNVIAANIRKKGLLRNQNIDDNIRRESDVKYRLSKILDNVIYTKGEISKFNNEWMRISLINSYNWEDYHSSWAPNDRPTQFTVEDTLIIKNGKRIEYADLKTGDVLKVIRYDDKALVMYVEE